MIRMFFLVLALAGSAAAQEVADAPAAVLRGLDKVAGTASDMEIAAGASASFGQLQITLGACRYPVDDPTSNAYARLTILDTALNATIFDGWMIADSPALSALDHQRYDVWVVRCKTD